MNHVIMSKNLRKYGSLLSPKRRGTAISGKGIGLCPLQVLYCSPLEVEMNGNPQRNLQQKYAKIWIFHFSPDLMPCASPSTGFPGGPNLCRPRTSDVGTLKIIDPTPIQKVRQKPNEPPKNMESSGGLWRHVEAWENDQECLHNSHLGNPVLHGSRSSRPRSASAPKLCDVGVKHLRCGTKKLKRMKRWKESLENTGQTWQTQFASLWPSKRT